MTPTRMRSFCATERDTELFGARLADHLKPGDVIGFKGALGAGKSVLARSIIRHMMEEPDLVVPSPSFTLVQIYDLPDGHDLWHVDLYRLERPADLLELGLEDAFDDSIMLLEWPDRAETLLPKNYLALELAIKNDQARLITANMDKVWQERIGHLFPDESDETL